MRFYPYHISHLHLNGDQIVPPELVNNAAYVVIWWKEIPLGELFIEQGKTFSSKEYYYLVIDAISATVDQYAAKQGFKTGEYNLHALQKIFAAYTELALPASVDVSVVICTRNRPAHVRSCLQSLTQLACSPKEIIVVDNAPVDDQTRNIVSQFPNVTYCREPRPGLDIARNAGITQATSPIVAFIDDDVTVHPHCFYWTWRTFENTSISAMTGLVLAAELQTEAQYIFEKEWRFNRGYRNKVYDSGFFNSTLKYGPPVWQIGAGANMAFRKSILQQTGNFDERLDVGAAGCNGDSELWFRILAKGFSIAYNPRAVVEHQHRKEMKALKKQLFNYMRGFTVAALIQQKFCSEAGYKRHIFLRLPKWYLKELGKGFPKYRMRYATIFSEIRGMFSGLLYYSKHKN
jgi:glycosyltransferase involved in cell wall biosynthesis